MSGAARASGRANGYADDRSRLTGANGAVRPEAPGSRNVTSPQFGMTTPHRRSLSANPRRMTDDKKGGPERTFDPHGDRFVSRAQSPEKLQRRGTLPDRRTAEVRRQKSVELRSKDQRAEPVQEQKWVHEVALDNRNPSALASRVKKPPMATEILQMLPPPKSLNDMTLEMQEAALIEDLLFVLMGYEGQYIRFGKGFNPKEERDRLSGPTFRILPGLDPSLHDLAKSMLKAATYYSALETFVDVQSRAEFGAVNHALCASIRKVLQDYLVMIAQLETQFLTNETFTIHVLNIHILPSCHILHQLYGLAHELLKKNALLDDESEEEDDDTAFDYDKIIEKLTDGGDMVPGNMTGKKIFKGGVVLGIVTRRLESMSGDPAARSLLTSLLRDASRPYMVMLNQWLHHGSINDPHAEFMIREQKSIGRERLERDYIDEYWERRYTIRDHDVPPQLEAVRDKVLLAGKYLNVVRECGGVDVSQVVADLPVSFDDTRFLENVNSAYAHANESLMQLLLTTHALPPRLRSLKHYFFLDPSDFFSYFLELGASELRKPVKSVNTGKLQSLLDLVLRQPGTAVSLDPFKEDVKVEMNEITLINSLQRVVNITGIEQGEALQPLANQPAVEADKNATGFTSLQLDYSVPFPVSLVISRKTVWRYQALFRFLLSLRHLESQLSTTWQTQTRVVSWSHKGSNQDLELWKRRAWTLRARMLVYVQQVLYFCTAEVIEPNWAKFMSRLRTQDGGNAQGQKGQKAGLTRTVDELMQDHVDFLDTCLKECMLTNSKLLKVNSKLMQTCTIFAAYTNWLSRELEKSEPDLSGPVKPPNMTTDQWRRFQATKAANARAAPDGSGSGGGGKQGQAQAAHAGDVSALEDAEARISNLSDIIRKWESNFGRHMKILSDSLNHYAATETVVLLSLCARLSTVNQGTEWAAMGVEDDDA
ncbi:Spindle pole body component alp4 [Escovopsis weberi]|uniref:Spindle pole body component n=1 Tax=Escovopsis weberi TaxID=150374 RepID=A0A0N0RT63_ESCWE|nr:Spindle pole body component alp4 [Escovopsis weberi]